MYNQEKFQSRIVRIKNTSGAEIPPNSFAEIDDWTTAGVAEVIKPSADSLPAAQLVITGPAAIPANGTSIAAQASEGSLWVEYYGTAPVAGDDFGTVENQWYGEAGKSGFKSSGSQGDVTNVSPVSSSMTLYKAIADESGGEIQVKVVDSSGTVSGDAITLKVVPGGIA